MKIAIIGTGYVGLVTGVCFAEVGHYVTCIDQDAHKISLLQQGISPIYEKEIDVLLARNLRDGRLAFTGDLAAGVQDKEVIFIAVGTPSLPDGRADLQYIDAVARQIASHLTRYTVIVTKSTVPVGTNDRIREIIAAHLPQPCAFDVVSNPEFLREGTAIQDTFHGERIVIGADSPQAAALVAKVYEPFHIPVIHTDIRSAEMIKYASNAFLATKISFINEIANICERVGADVEDVVLGMGSDSRIGPKFLQSGIGYGGSCFPKDTKALVQIAGNVDYDFDLLKSVITVNNKQQVRLVEKALRFYEGSLQHKKVAILGLAFKPGTDDIREAASLKIIDELRRHGCKIRAYDPIAMPNARKLLGETGILYCASYREALAGADFAMLVTEWEEFKQMDLHEVKTLLAAPVLFDGRNCFRPHEMREKGFTYFSIGRQDVIPSHSEGSEPL